MDQWIQLVTALITGGGIVGILNWFLSKRRTDHDIFIDNYAKILQQKDEIIKQKDMAINAERVSYEEKEARLREEYAERERRLREEVSQIRKRWNEDLVVLEKIEETRKALKEHFIEVQIENAKPKV